MSFILSLGRGPASGLTILPGLALKVVGVFVPAGHTVQGVGALLGSR